MRVNNKALETLQAWELITCNLGVVFENNQMETGICADNKKQWLRNIITNIRDFNVYVIYGDISGVSSSNVIQLEI